MPSFDTSIEWFKSWEMDYFSWFIKMWLSAISAIKIINQDDSLRKERQLIEFMKNNSNPFKRKYNRLTDNIYNNITANTSLDDESDKLRTYFEIFLKKYDGWLFWWKSINKDDDIWLKPQMNWTTLDSISFKDFIHNNSLRLSRKPRWYIKFWDIYIKDDFEIYFPYLIEMLYMIRNLLVHWELNINEENKKILEASYNILKILISDTVSNANT